MKTKNLKIALIAMFAILFIGGNASFGQTAPAGWNIIFSSSKSFTSNFITKDSGWCKTENNVLYTTADGGQTWNSTTTFVDSLYQTYNNTSSYYFNDSVGVKLLSNTTIERTINNGLTWTIVQDSVNGGFDKNGNLYCGSKFYYTKDMGLTWIKITLPNNIGWVVSLFPTDNIIYAYNSFSQTSLIKTTTMSYFPSTPSISYVTVDTATNKNKIVWKSTPNQYISLYNIYVLDSVSQYEKIGSVPFNTGELSFTDSISNPSSKSFSYKISITDTLGLESDLSVAQKTLHVAVSGNEIIITDKPTGFSYSSFYIYKGMDENNLSLFKTIDTLSNAYTDNSKGNYPYYRVGVVVPSSKSKGEVTMAFSNIASRNLNTGVENLNEKLLNISVYPNPVINTLNVSMNNVKQIQIYNTTGSEVISTTDKKIDVLNLNSGVYFIKVSDGLNVYTGKFIKQ